MTRKLALALVILAAACSDGRTTTAEARDAPPPAAESTMAEELAPDFTVETFDGERFSLSDQRGRVVVLNFFESW